jgi:hypothetical protein
MTISQGIASTLFAVALVAAPLTTRAAAPVQSTVGVGGYDLVSYHTGRKPLPGNGASEANKETFEAAPERYLPAYGGWCAFGVSVGKKFVGDPNVWEVVDGRLYLNLDNAIKGRWAKDIPGNITKADANWPKIRDRDPADL